MGMEERIYARLQDGLTPQDLVVENFSDQHAGHASSPGTGESHFRVRVVSDRFDGLSRLARQRLVYDLLQAEMAGGVHALTMTLMTPAEMSGKTSIPG